jgi:glycosyltransferase involved in cell wall biosynthesis
VKRPKFLTKPVEKPVNSADAGRQHVVVLNWRDRFHPQAGGAEVFCHQIAEQLTAAGHQVTMVVARPPRSEAPAADESHTGPHDIERITSPDAGTRTIRIRRLGGQFGVYPMTLLWLLRHRRNIDAVIDSQNGIPFFSPLALGRRVPVALVIHHVHQEQFALYLPGPLAAFGRWMESTGCRLAYGSRPVCVVSPSTRSEVRSRLRLRGPIYITPNGLTVPPVVAANPRELLSGSPAVRAPRPTIVCVGRLVVHKQWDLLLEAVAKILPEVPDLQLHLIGSGDQEETLRARAGQDDLVGHVTLHGRIPDAERDALLAAAWLTASTSRGEGWGLAVMEAAAAGIPAVAFDVAGLRDAVIDGETGWLVQPDELAARLVEALTAVSDPQRAATMASDCRTWAGRHTWQSTTDRLLSVLRQEGGRLGRIDELRLARADTSVLVELTSDHTRTFDPDELRVTDQANFCAACSDAGGPYRLLLTGADELDAVRALVRSGLSGTPPKIRLARPRDLLTWSGLDTAHGPHCRHSSARRTGPDEAAASGSRQPA